MVKLAHMIEGDGSVAAWPIYRRLLRRTRPYLYLLVFASVGMVLEAGATAGFASLLRPIIDSGFDASATGFARMLPWLMVAIFVVRGIGNLVAEYCMAGAARSVICDLRRQVFFTYLQLPASYFDRESTGQLISRLTYNIEQIAEASTNALTIAVKDSLYVIFLIGVMFVQSVQLTLAVLLIGPFIAVIVVTISRRFRKVSRRIQDTMGDVSHRTGEVVAGHREVKIYGGQEQEAEIFDVINRRNRRQHLKLVATKSTSTSIIQLMAGLALAGIVYLATRDIMQEDITAGEFTTFITAMLGILPSLKRLTNVQALIQRGVAAADTVFAVLDRDVEEDKGTLEKDTVLGRVEFRDVELRYSADGPQVLRNISFVMEPGSVTALVGRSGSGKTSLANLLARFYDPSAGAILLDDVPASSYRLENYRRHIAYVGQSVVLFADTVRNNIAYGALSNATDDQIAEAARKAYAMEFISNLPDGMDTRLGEGGVQLSGGQRQRIAIARALLKDSAVLILDEATSALDNESERAIKKALERAMDNRSTLVIAHRLSTIENADQVLVLERGRIVERGRHADLLAAGGQYATLYQMQFSDSPP